jgi:hypothetical protein
MRNTIVLILVFAMYTAISLPALSNTVFSDDFQGQQVDEAPAKWMNVMPGQAGTTGIIAEDPQDANNMVMKITVLDEVNVLVANMDDLTEYIAEWDWMWESGWQTVAIHTQADGTRYHLSVDTDALANWEIWSWEAGNWGGPFVTGEAAQEANVWHSFQLSVNQAHIVFKGKERNAPIQFDQLDPILEMNGEDNAFTKGKFGIADGPVSYIDNVVIYIGSKAVNSVGRLATTWAMFKTEF